MNQINWISAKQKWHEQELVNEWLLPQIKDNPVVPPFLTGCTCRTYAAIFSFCAGVMPPMPMLGRSLL